LEGKEKKKRRFQVGKEIPRLSKSFMNVQESTYKYKEYKMAIDEVHNDVVIAVNANKDIEIIEC